jgi:hypothetical protein
MPTHEAPSAARPPVRRPLARPSEPVQAKSGCSCPRKSAGDEAPCSCGQKKSEAGGQSDAAEHEADEIGARLGEDLAGLPVTSGALHPEAQARAEEHLGVSLAGTVIDAGGAAQETAAREHALALTEGSHVSFGAGKLTTATPSGRALLGHELTHVAQQRAAGMAGVQRAPDPSAPKAAPAWDPFGIDKKGKCTAETTACVRACNNCKGVNKKGPEAAGYRDCLTCCGTAQEVCNDKGNFITPEGGCISRCELSRSALQDKNRPACNAGWKDCRATCDTCKGSKAGATDAEKAEFEKCKECCGKPYNECESTGKFVLPEGGCRPASCGGS